MAPRRLGRLLPFPLTPLSRSRLSPGDQTAPRGVACCQPRGQPPAPFTPPSATAPAQAGHMSGSARARLPADSPAIPACPAHPESCGRSATRRPETSGQPTGRGLGRPSPPSPPSRAPQSHSTSPWPRPEAAAPAPHAAPLDKRRLHVRLPPSPLLSVRPRLTLLH